MLTTCPGWDCHGLPIEWKVEESYRAKGQDKDSVPVQSSFAASAASSPASGSRSRPRSSSASASFGDWERPYTTMAYAAEAQIVREIGKFLINGGLYAGSRPVLWSVAEKTALADAEVEYHDHTSTTIWVRFPVVAVRRMPRARPAPAS